MLEERLLKLFEIQSTGNRRIFCHGHSNNWQIFHHQPTDSNIIIFTMKQLKESNLNESGGTSLRFMNYVLPVIIPYITCIINTFIVTATFPNCGTTVKKGNPEESGNYRPVFYSQLSLNNGKDSHQSTSSIYLPELPLYQHSTWL